MQTDSTPVLEIRTLGASSQQLQDGLGQFCHSNDVVVELPGAPKRSFRSSEPVVIAVIQACGMALTALVTAVFSLSRQHRCRRVIIRDGDKTIELPADFVMDDSGKNRLRELVQTVQEMQHPKIDIVQ